MRVASVMETSGDLCLAAWTLDTRARFSRECAWWPSDAEIDKFLRPISDGFLRKRAFLEAVAARRNERAERSPPRSDDG